MKIETFGRAACMGLVLAAGALRAETAYFLVTNKYVDCNYTATYKGTTQLWADDYVPTNADDVVYIGLPEAPLVGNGRFYPMGSKVFTIDSIAWAPYGFSFYFMQNAAGITLRDAANCWASWYSSVGGVTFSKKTGTEGPLVFRRMHGSYRTVFNAPAATDEIRITDLYRGGLIDKRGAGELCLERPTGSRQAVNLYAGTLVLGHTDTADQPATNRYFHLDASAADTLLTYARADGRTCVTNWLDADGKTLKATPVTVSDAPDYATCPFLGDETANGVRLVSFGGYSKDAQDVATNGPAARMWLNYQSGAREIFQVVKVNGTKGHGFYLSQFYQDGFRLDANAESLHTLSDTYVTDSYKMASFNQRLDGVPFANMSQWGPQRDINRLAVISSFESHAAKPSAGWFLCCKYSDTSVYGGYSAAEVLVYDRILTETERQATIRYLTKKWLKPEDRTVREAGLLSVRAADTCTRVEAGARADVKAVRVHDPAHALVKTGAGELRVEETYPDTAKIRVREGRVVFTDTKPAPPADPQPAAGAYLHLDATQAGSFIEELDGEGAPTGRILGWKDWRAGHTLYATNDVMVTVNATVAPASMNGRASVDFGTSIADTSAAFQIKDASGEALPLFAAVFVVWENITGTKDAMPHPLGGNEWSFLRSSKNDLAGAWYDVGAHAEIQGARWTVDGAPWNRDGDAYGLGFGEPTVWGAHFPTRARVSYLGKSQTGRVGGGVRIGEALFYTRPLTDAERRDTEAYLLKKWKNAAHPAYRTRVGTLAFDAGVTNELAVASGTRTIATVEGDGTLVKTGAGAAHVASLANTSLAVQGGSLEAVYHDPSLVNLLSPATYHFDAEAAASLTTRTNGNNVSILRMAHATRANGNAADGTQSPYVTAVTNTPKLVETTIAGRTRRVVDFGTYFGGKAVDGVYPVDTDAAAFKISHTWGQREFYAVVRDTDPQRRKPIFDSWEYFIDRGANGALFVPVSCHDCFGSYALTLDGEDTTYSTVLPEGWHVVFIAPGPEPAPLMGFGATEYAGSLKMGGQQIAELLVFDAVHTADERTKITDYLRYKWLGQGSGKTLALTALEAASDTVLTVGLDGYQTVTAARVGGAGTVALPAGVKLTLDTVAVTVSSPDTVSCTTIDGPAELTPGATVSLAAPAGVRLAQGSYPILKADALTGTIRCTLVDPAACCKGWHFRRAADTLWLDVVPSGTVILIR